MALPSDNEKISFFISHRNEHELTADALKDIVESGAPMSTRAFLSKGIPKGADWLNQIHEALQQADYLILCYGDPTEDWSWCLYETGYFLGHHRPRENEDQRVWCLKRDFVPPPGPISNIQAVESADELFRCICAAYKLKNISYDANKIREELKNILGYFSVQPNIDGLVKIHIDIPVDAENLPDQLPDDTVVRGNPDLFSDLFGVREARSTWKHLIQAGAKGRSAESKIFFNRWKLDVAKTIFNARNNNYIASHCLLWSKYSGHRYRMILSRSNFSINDRCGFEFIMVRDLGGYPDNMPGTLVALISSIRMATRIKYDVIRELAPRLRAFDDKYYGKSSDLQGQDREDFDIERNEIIHGFHERMGQINIEADSRGMANAENLSQSLKPFPEDQKRVHALIRHWAGVESALYDALGAAPSSGLRVHDQGLCGENIRNFRKALKRLKMMNDEFLYRGCKVLFEETKIPDDYMESIISEFPYEEETAFSDL